MKRISKVIVFVLTMCFALSILAPAATVSAASKITLKSGAAAPSTVYTNKSYTLKVAGTAVKFYSSNKKVATIGLTTGKLKPVAPGTVKITAKSKKTGKAVATMTFKVNQRATSVQADVTDLYLSVNDTYTIKTTKTPATSTDVIRMYSTDKTVATVGATSGNVTAVANGKATIKIYCKATAATKNSSTYNKTAIVNVYVGDYVDKAVQISTTELSVNFKTLTSTPAASDFKLTNLSTSEVVQIKSVTPDEKDTKKLIITTYNEIKDGKEYELVYKNTKSRFTATNGTIAKLSITPTSIPANVPTAIYVEERDVNGVLIAKFAYGDANTSLDFTIDPGTNGYLSGDELVLSEKTAKAVANAIYHTYEYDSYGNETGVIKTGDVTITGTAESQTPSISYHIGDITRADFDVLTKTNSTLAVNDERYLSIRMLNNNKAEISNYSDYTVSSSNQSVLLVDGNLSSDSTLPITAIKPGTANIIIKNSSGTVIQTLPVTVVAEREATSLTLDKSSATISGSSEVEDTAVFALTLLDQYGQEMSCENIDVSLLKATSEVTSQLYAEQYHIDEEKDTVSFFGDVLGEGTYQFKISVGDVFKNVTVIVKMPSDTASTSYKLIIGDGSSTTQTVDAKVSSAEDMNKTLPIRIGLLKGGVLAAYQPITEISVTLNGKAVDSVITESTDGGYQFIVTGGDSYISKADKGTYKLIVTFDKDGRDSKMTGTIIVTDTQPALNVVQNAIQYKNIYSLSDHELAKAVFENCFTFYIGNKKYTAADLEIEFSEDSYVLKNSYVLFKKVVIYAPLTGSSNIYVPYVTTISKSVTIK